MSVLSLKWEPVVVFYVKNSCHFGIIVSYPDQEVNIIWIRWDNIFCLSGLI